MKKIAHVILRGTIKLVSGMRIGGSDDILQIGGTDLTCIKDPVTGKPYIPGSSIKGKMRSSLERHLGKFSPNRQEPCNCANPACPVCRVFGPHKNTRHDLGPTRLIVRDAPSIDGFSTFENKTESTIQRNVGTAQHPRTVERVPPGAVFALDLAVQVYDNDSVFKYKDIENQEHEGQDALIEVVCDALGLVQQTGLGSGIGKGYGQVAIELTEEFEDTPKPLRPKRQAVASEASAPAPEGPPA